MIWCFHWLFLINCFTTKCLVFEYHLRWFAVHQCLRTHHLEWIIFIIIITTIIVTIITSSSFYCYYYRFQVSILPCGLTLGATASHAPTTSQGKSWFQTPDWVDGAQTCDFKSGSYSSEQGGEMLPSCSRILQKHFN